MKKVIRFIFCLIFFSNSLAYAYEKPQLSSYFLSDSTLVGQDVFYVVKYSHHPDEEFIFPDSNYIFAPFEFVNKLHFSTKTNNQKSIDSVVYQLRTFELKPITQFSTPVFIINNNDTVKLYSNYSQIAIKSVILEQPKELKLIADASFIDMIFRINGLLWIILGVIGIIVLIVLIVILYKPLVKAFSNYRKKKDYDQFIFKFDQLKFDYEKNPKSFILENAVKSWKDYLQKIRKEPFSTYTSKEIIQKIDSESLENALKSIDKGIYGNMKLNSIDHDLSVLKQIAVDYYLKNDLKTNQIKENNV